MKKNRGLLMVKYFLIEVLSKVLIVSGVLGISMYHENENKIIYFLSILAVCIGIDVLILYKKKQ
jgi:hypothetical protein